MVHGSLGAGLRCLSSELKVFRMIFRRRKPALVSFRVLGFRVYIGSRV